MSESVWIEQVDTALSAFIGSFIVPAVGEPSVRVKVRKPDEDFKKEEYPLVTLYNLYSKGDYFRKNQNDIRVSLDTVNRLAVVEKSCDPYNLFYQIDFWAKKQSHMNYMMQMWISHTNGGRYFNLPVLDQSGKERNCYSQRREDFKKSDSLKGTERLFHSIITYKIQVELDENIQSVQSVATEMQFTTKKEGT